MEVTVFLVYKKDSMHHCILQYIYYNLYLKCFYIHLHKSFQTTLQAFKDLNASLGYTHRILFNFFWGVNWLCSLQKFSNFAM